MNENTEMKQYVKCSVCGKKIYFGEKVLTKLHYVGVYCSPNCFANDFNIGCCETPLSKELAQRKEVTIRETDVDEAEKAKEINDLLYIIRTNMTSITRYVKHNREQSPTLTEGQFIDRHLKYRELANVAVDNILNYINGTQKERVGEQ